MGKFCFILIATCTLVNIACILQAQDNTVRWIDDFNYTTTDQLTNAGWTLTRPAGISLAANAVVLDGTGGDCAINIFTSFSNDVYDWKAEVRGMWLGQGHSVLSVFVSTEQHSYSWAADGYYKEFSFYRDIKKILHFGNYQEKANQYVTLTMVRQANTFSFYFNGELINTYTEEDTVPSKVTGLGLVSPWKGDAKYDYYQIGEPNAAFAPSTPTESTNSFPLFPVLIGGGFTAAVVGGIVVYYFFIAGHTAGSTAGAGAGILGTGMSAPSQQLQQLQNVSAQGVASAGSSVGVSGVAGAQAQAGAALQSTQPAYGAGAGIESPGIGVAGAQGQGSNVLAGAGAALQSTQPAYGAGAGVEAQGTGGASTTTSATSNAPAETRTIKPKPESGNK